MKKHYDRVCAEINLDNVTHNLNEIHRIIDGNARIICVIKTDGYGHGALPLAKQMEKLPFVHGYAVATAEEALQLKNNGIRKPIIIIGYSFPSSYEEMIVRDVRITVFREDTLNQLNEIAKDLGLICKVHIKVDTGMSRIGIFPDNAGLEFVGKSLKLSNIKVEGIFTHYARADEADLTSAEEQFTKFNDFVKLCEQTYDYKFDIVHSANSAAIMEMPKAHFDCVRAGIIMYGMWPSDEVHKDKLNIKPLLSLKSHIVYVKEITAGTSVSYGGIFTATAPTRVATVPIGYGDGYPRLLSGKGMVLCHGKKVPILGRICMDQLMIDVSDIHDINEGDEVTLVGNEGDEQITMEDLAAWSGMLNYEIACIIGKRVPRLYFINGEEVYSRDFFNDTPLNPFS